MVLPLKLRLFGADTGRALTDEWLVLLDSPTKEVAFEGLAERPALSINRGFSAPVIVESSRSAADLALLSAHAVDSFARYAVLQQLMLDPLLSAVTHGRADHGTVIAPVCAPIAAPTHAAACNTPA